MYLASDRCARPPLTCLQLALTAFAGANFGSSRQGIQLLDMTTRAVKIFALEATAPQEGSSLSRCGNFGEKAFSGKAFIGHQPPPGRVKRKKV